MRQGSSYQGGKPSIVIPPLVRIRNNPVAQQTQIQRVANLGVHQKGLHPPPLVDMVPCGGEVDIFRQRWEIIGVGAGGPDVLENALESPHQQDVVGDSF